MPIYTLGTHSPQIDPQSWIAPNATVIGQVHLAKNASISCSVSPKPSAQSDFSCGRSPGFVLRKRIGQFSFQSAVYFSSSTVGLNLPGYAVYIASKAAVESLTQVFAKEMRGRNITVNAVAPGFIRTEMTEDINENEWKKQIPAGRFGEPEEVADLVSFLVSPNASYITGEVISINGGLHT